MERKRTKVIMLPTDKAEKCIIKHEEGLGLGYIKGFLSQGYLKGNNETSHHLYFINGEEIKEGDWAISHGKVIQWAKDFKENFEIDLNWHKEDKKIIATTDPGLKILNGKPYMSQDLVKVWIYPEKRLPQPSQAFIEKYCKVGGIDEVDVEYVKQKTCKSPHCDDLCDACEEPILKVDSHNIITIHSIKEKLYTIEEVAELCAKAYWDGNLNTGDIIPEDWIKENL